MKVIEENLEMLWEVMSQETSTFDESDLFNILQAYYGHEAAYKLRKKGQIPPCYQYNPCVDCKYNRYCLNQNKKIEDGTGNGEKSRAADDFADKLLENLGRILFDSEPR